MKQENAGPISCDADGSLLGPHKFVPSFPIARSEVAADGFWICAAVVVSGESVLGIRIANVVLARSSPSSLLPSSQSLSDALLLQNTIHASLLRPNLGSSFAGLGTVQSRSELKQNIETIWGVVTGRKDQS